MQKQRKIWQGIFLIRFSIEEWAAGGEPCTASGLQAAEPGAPLPPQEEVRFRGKPSRAIWVLSHILTYCWPTGDSPISCGPYGRSSNLPWPRQYMFTQSCHISEANNSWHWLILGWETSKEVQGCYEETGNGKPGLRVTPAPSFAEKVECTVLQQATLRMTEIRRRCCSTELLTRPRSSGCPSFLYMWMHLQSQPWRILSPLQYLDNNYKGCMGFMIPAWLKCVEEFKGLWLSGWASAWCVPLLGLTPAQPLLLDWHSEGKSKLTYIWELCILGSFID